MQDTELLLSLAEIAGVFVGFGALIAVRSGGPSEPTEITPMRGVVGMGMLTIIAALAPVTLVGMLGAFAVNARTPESRVAWAVEAAAFGLTPGEVVGTAAYVLYLIAMVLTPIIIMLGVAPDLEAPLYFTVVVLILLGAGWTLLWLVFSQRRPADA